MANAKGNAQWAELHEPARTLRVDSKVLEKAEIGETAASDKDYEQRMRQIVEEENVAAGVGLGGGGDLHVDQRGLAAQGHGAVDVDVGRRGIGLALAGGLLKHDVAALAGHAVLAAGLLGVEVQAAGGVEADRAGVVGGVKAGSRQVDGSCGAAGLGGVCTCYGIYSCLRLSHAV